MNKTAAYMLALREQYRRDFIRYAREQLWIQTKRAGQIVTLDVMSKPLQQMVVKAVYRQFRELGYVDGNIIKGRQQGSSTVTQALQFWKASLNRNYNTLLIAQDKPTTKSIFEKARFFYEHLDLSIKPLVRASNREELVFASPVNRRASVDAGLGSRMDFLNSENMLAGTGTTRQGLHLSECGKYKDEDIEILLGSLYPCILHGQGTIRIKESTPFVGGKWFRECCDAAREGRVEEFFVFCPWYLEPDYVRPLNPKYDKKLARMVGLDAEEQRIVKLAKRGQPKDGVPPFEIRPEQLKWRRWQIGQPGFDENIFLQEYPSDYDSAWISFDNRAFNHQRLYEIRDRDIRQPLRMIRIEPGPVIIEDLNMRMHSDLSYTAVWEEPIPREDYDIGADVAAGIEGGDWSTASVVKRRTREQVAEAHLHCDPADFGTFLFWLGLYYNTAHIAVEWQGGYGVAAEGQLKRMNYPNLYLWRHRDQAVPIPTKKTGWQTTQESKAYLIAGVFRTFVNRGAVTIRSRVLLNEMFNFIQIPYGQHWDYRAGEGHDDLVISMGIALVIGDDESQAGLEEGRPLAQPVAKTGNIAFVDDYDFRAPPRSSLARELKGSWA